MSEDQCPNCGEPGNPGHHWLSQPGVYEGYVCFGEDEGIDESHDFVPISSAYKPMGWLYRPIANDLCLCGTRKVDHG